MRKTTRQFFILVLLFFVVLCSHAQVAISLFPSPAKQFFIDDMWRTVFINASTSPVSVYAQFIIRDGANNPILNVTTQPISFTPGMNQVNATEAAGGKWVYGNSSKAAILQETGKLPFGNYSFCAMVYSTSGNKSLGTDCEERDIEPLSPPELSSPFNMQEVDITNPLLTWIPPRPLFDIQVMYSLRLVELQSGQNPADAMVQNPPLLNLSSLTSLTLQYPADAPALQAGKQYAWQVAASYDNYNLGSTDIWVFKVKAQEQKESDDIIYPFVSKKSDAKFYVSHGIFRFAYNNMANEKSLTYAITYMDKKTETLPSLPQVVLKPGTNRLQVDLRHNSGLKDKRFYTLEIKDSKGQTYKLLYYYEE